MVEGADFSWSARVADHAETCRFVPGERYFNEVPGREKNRRAASVVLLGSHLELDLFGGTREATAIQEMTCEQT